MSNVTTTKQLQGKVVGWMVKFIPLRKQGSDVATHMRMARIAAFLTVQVNGKKCHSIPCRSAELVYDTHRLRELGVKTAGELTDALVNDHKIKVMNTIIDQHPLNGVLPFRERVTTRPNKRALRAYNLAHE
jgi:hypothetical protein